MGLTRENPLRSGPRMGKTPDPVSIVIFGATGDLTARKLAPALFSLARETHLSPEINIVGFARRQWNDADFGRAMQAGVTKYGRHKADQTSVWEGFAKCLRFLRGEFDRLDDYAELDRFLKTLAQERNRQDNRVYYLAAPPQSYPAIVSNLGSAGMTNDSQSGWRRIVIEKPFGSDLSTARQLNDITHQVFNERQIFRIDHYLGKETVQNLLVLRFANAIFEPIWSRSFVDHVQISVAESVGVGNRIGFYDQAGVVRDIFQNHLLQVLTLIAMEAPVALEADAIRDEKVKVLRAIRPVTDIKHDTVRAQYDAGIVEGQNVAAYCDEPGASRSSETATFAAIKWHIDNWRWQGVPFYTRSGKRMVTRASEVSIHFKRPPHLLFDTANGDEMRANVLAIRIQPDEGISLCTEAKLPGLNMARRSVTMDFRYGTSFGIVDPPDAYERLLLDAILGDATLFARSDEIEWAWRLVDPILKGWKNKRAPALEAYESGSWGPQGADALIERDGRQWRRL